MNMNALIYKDYAKRGVRSNISTYCWNVRPDPLCACDKAIPTLLGLVRGARLALR